jgi:branched-chain amino acid transport system substrate-binding protein
MASNRTYKSAARAAALLAGSFVLAAPALAQENIKVGVILSLSGPAAPFGIPERDTIQVLTDKYNADVGPNGKRIELVFHDDQTDPTEGARGATRLIQQEKVQAILGATTGSATLALMPIAAASSVPVLCPCGTISLTSKEHSFFPWFFRTSINDELAVAGALEKGLSTEGRKNLAVMYQEDAYGKATKDFIVKSAKDRKINVVAEVSAPLNAKDLTSAATKVRNANPDTVFVQTSAPALGAAFMRGAKQVGLEVPAMGSMALNQRAFVDAAGSAADGMIIVSLGNWDDPSPKQKALGDLLTKAGKTPAGFGEVIASTGFVALAEAIKRSPSPVTGKSIRDALETICHFRDTYLDGELCYTPDNHEGIGADSLAKMEVRGGKMKTIQ